MSENRRTPPPNTPCRDALDRKPHVFHEWFLQVPGNLVKHFCYGYHEPKESRGQNPR